MRNLVYHSSESSILEYFELFLSSAICSSKELHMVPLRIAILPDYQTIYNILN